MQSLSDPLRSGDRQRDRLHTPKLNIASRSRAINASRSGRSLCLCETRAPGRVCSRGSEQALANHLSRETLLGRDRLQAKWRLGVDIAGVRVLFDD